MKLHHHYFHRFLWLLIIGLIVFFAPWRLINWGTIQLSPAQTITVVGEASEEQNNEVAVFTAGVNAVNDDKDAALAEVNQGIADIIQALKDFGIPETDIKTQNVSVYRMEDSVYEEGRQRTKPGQWRVDNSIEIKLRDIAKTTELTALLTDKGVTNLYGPNFQLDKEAKVDEVLYQKAMDNAREKAETLAKASGKRLGAVVNVSEGSTTFDGVFPFESRMGGGGGYPTEPGTSSVHKSLTVVFELR